MLGVLAGVGLAGSAPVAQNVAYTFNNVATTHVRQLPATDADGDPLTYRVTLQSFGSADFGFTWNASGSWSVRRLSVSDTVWFRYVATDPNGNQSNEAMVTFKFA